ncbi:unnamed protein product [Pieris macdunnoughi]|uniref:Uncharacterized protein n=1 Tax=Pieris macdunnoughi TaxID=345717 RepID=A0A821XB42_9NEOP|nr:unnamed protein product [Pieris macdunnoughi]
MLPRTPPKPTNKVPTPSTSATPARRTLVEMLSPAFTRVKRPTESAHMEMAKEYRQTGLQALAASRNLKGELKTAITEAIEGLFGVVGLIDPSPTTPPNPPAPAPHTPQATKATITPSTITPPTDTHIYTTQLLQKLEAHSRLLDESNKALQEHTRVLKASPKPAPSEIQPVSADPHKTYKSYAKAAATPTPCRAFHHRVRRGSRHNRTDTYSN